MNTYLDDVPVKVRHRFEWIRRIIKAKKPITSAKTPALEVAFSSSALPPPWIELPADVTADILRRLGTAEMLESAQKVCTTWWKVCQDPALYRVINLRNPEYGGYESVYDMMCRRAVDLSQGQLIDLSIEDFGDDYLIDYIVNRASNLQRLTIAHCPRISGTALSKAVKKLPQLEKLHLIIVHSISTKDIEAIGVSCPMLKSFSIHWSEDPSYPGDEQPLESKHCNEYALAIGKTMQNLRHLRLLANWMTNEGLEAILDGCPHLESLDIRKCSGVDLTGALGKRCYEQIQNLRDPSEPISDLEWLDVWFDYFYGDDLESVDSYYCVYDFDMYGYESS